MARSTRATRQVSTRYSADEYVLQAKPKTRKKVVEVPMTENASPTKKTRSARVKGNLCNDERNNLIFGSPVLRDRTNLATPEFKDNVLMKKGAGDGEKATKSVRRKNDDVGVKRRPVESKATKQPAVTTKTVRRKNDDIEENRGSIETRASKQPTVTAKSVRRKSDDVDGKHRSIEPRVSKLRTLTAKTVRRKSDDANGKRRSIESGVKKQATVTAKSVRRKRDNVDEKQRSIEPKPSKRPAVTAKSVVSKNNDGEEKRGSIESGTSEEPAAMAKSVLIKDNAGEKRRSIESTVSKQPAFMKTNKFFKSKRKQKDDYAENKSPVKKTTIVKRKKVVASHAARLSCSFRFRQTTLEESFAKENIRKNLRPRRALKNYLEKTAASDKSDVQPKDGATDGSKRPVYLTVKSTQGSDGDDESEIYEFRYNRNDSTERIPKKKRKKRILTGRVKKSKTRKSATKKLASRAKAISRIAEEVHAKNDDLQDDNDIQIPVDDQNDAVSVPVVNIHPVPSTSSEKQTARPTIVKDVELKGDIRVKLNVPPKPIEPAAGENREIRKTNAFIFPPSVPYRAMLNHPLLNKSLSPISKAMDNFDPGSPWRAPTVVNREFSRVKAIVQSTPQIQKLSSEPKMTRTRNTIRANEQNNEKIEVPVIATDDKTAQSKARIIGKSPRKFGTEISNENAPSIESKAINKNPDGSGPKQISPLVKSPRKFGTEISNVRASAIDAKITNENTDKAGSKQPVTLGKSPRKFGTEISNVNPSSIEVNVIIANSGESGSKQPATPGKSPRKFGTVISNVNSPRTDAEICNDDEAHQTSLDFSYCDEKENSGPIGPSPKAEKPLKNRRNLATNLVSTRTLNKVASPTKTASEAGASGSPKSSPSDETRLLKQSNLNNFLNLDNVPTSTRITTIHGIFDDAPSTPITGKPNNAKKVKELNLGNAFGFDEDETYEEPMIGVSPIKPRPITVASRVPQKLVSKVEIKKKEPTKSGLARFSIGEMKKHLRAPIVEKIKTVQPIERIEEEIENRPKAEKPVVTFSDTFDLSIDNTEANDKENPLFADLEPVHFKQPPRHLYRRKRNAKCIAYSDDEDENGNAAALVNHPTKKRKISKVEKQQQKKLEEWAKDLNETFEEIDHFDLVVE